MKLNIKKFENPSGDLLKLNTAIDEAYDFYHNDVEDRKERERSRLLQLYTIKTPIEKTSINIDNNQGTGLSTSSGDDFVGEWRYNKGIYLNPNIIFKKYYNKDRLSRAITHELSHEDAYLKRPKDYTIDEYIAPLVLENITIKEKKYLDKAYKTDANTSSKNIEEKHATNRLLRHQLYLNFIKVNGRKPDSIEELDDFIRNTSDMSIMYLLRDLNDYGNDYFYNKSTDPKAVKDALIHVAQNNTGVVLYAKKGCDIKKYQTPSEPLNKNYPELVMKHWWEGDYEGFEKAKLSYDNYYGKILPEAEIIASKTTHAKTSDWNSEHNVAKDNKKYERTHQVESLKIASAVNHKMNLVGNTIGRTAVELGSSFTPLWWTVPTTTSLLNVSKGGYKDAAISAGLGLIAPYALGKYVIPGVFKGMSYLDNVASKNITPYRNYKTAKEFGKLVDGTELPKESILYQEPKTITFSPNKVTEVKLSLKFLERPSKLTKAERLGIPKGGKVPYTPEENNAFRNQINKFAEKYGYNTIGDEVTDPEVLEKYARALIKLHNTFYRGISYAPDEATLMKWASKPRPNAEMYITPYSDVAKGYGDPVELLRPYKLGSDRTQWFTEGNFDIIPSAGDRISQGYSGKSGIYAPWVSRKPVLTSQGRVVPKPKSPESELVVINTNLIPKRVIYKMPVFSSYIKPNGDYRFSPWWKVGEMSPTGSQNLPNMYAEFKQGGSIHIKEKNKGKFTESAKRAGKSVQEHARDVVNNPKATKLQKKRALFALNAKKWKHLNGGIMNYINIFKYDKRTEVKRNDRRRI